MHVDLRPRSFGELVGLTLSLSVAHLAKLFPIALVLAAPGLAATVIQRDLHPVQDAVTILLLNLAVIAVAFVVGPLASAASIKIVAASYTGIPCSLASGLATGLRRLGPLFGCSLAIGVAIMVGSILLIVPGLIAMTMYYVAPCSLVLENKGVGASMERSKTLSAGHRWRVFFLAIVVMVLMQLVPSMGLGMLLQMGLQGTGAYVVTLLVMAVFTVPGVIAPVVAFFDLRVRKEALDVTVLTELVDQIGKKVQKRASA